MDASARSSSIRYSRPRSIRPIPASAAPRSVRALPRAPTRWRRLGAASMARRRFARRTPRVFAQSVRVGDWLFIAGQDAVDVAQQTLFVGDLRAQTEQCVRQLQFIMEAAGGSLDDIVKTTVYLLAGQDRAVLLDAYGEQFRRRLRSPWMPAGLTMTVDALRPDCLAEIDAVAYLGGR